VDRAGKARSFFWWNGFGWPGVGRNVVQLQGKQSVLELILILLVVAAVAGLLGMGRVSGLALSGAKILIFVVLVLFLLFLLGVLAL
jgi:uncharacterized membrane protein YtjA (UPF0391 family)